jgi:hypothetical protein
MTFKIGSIPGAKRGRTNNNELGRVTSGNPHRKISYVTYFLSKTKCINFFLSFIGRVSDKMWHCTTLSFLGTLDGKGAQDNVTWDLRDGEGCLAGWSCIKPSLEATYGMGDTNARIHQGSWSWLRSPMPRRLQQWSLMEPRDLRTCVNLSWRNNR